MKKSLLFFLTTLLSFNSYSQITFEKGYYIDDSDKKTECMIMNMDWKNNPIEFNYKLSENGEANQLTINSVKEFGIYKVSKYIRKTVAIDRSSEDISKLSETKKPEFMDEELFLKVLFEGKSNLYVYVDTNLKKYFYGKQNSNIEQLVFKSYKNPDGSIGKNNHFRQQLLNDLKCSSLKISNVKSIAYSKKDLIQFFTEYSNCNGVDFINFEPKQKKGAFNLNLRPRINSSSLTAQSLTNSSRNIDSGNKFNFGFGLELEFILPFNKNKWAIIAEPTYQNFNADKTIDANNVVGGKLITKVKYNSIEIPFGLRHYFFLNNNNSKLFINTSYILDISSSNSSIEFNRADGSNLSLLEMKTNTNLAFGFGYKQNDKLTVELRYQTNRELLYGYTGWATEFKTISVILGYSLF